MNQDQIFGIIRHVLTTLGGVAVTKGWVDEESALELTGLVMSAIGFVWSFWVKRKSDQVEA
jgi:hypothetical protein